MKIVATRPATGSDTASPLSPVTSSPTRWVSRMYAAQQHAAPRAQSTPTTSTGPCHGSVSSTTPTAARPGQISARREWLRAAATPSGPRNSSALAVPSGSRTAAAMKSNVTPAVTMPSADAARDLLAQSTSSTRSAPLRVLQGIKADQATWPAGDSPVRELLQWRRLFDTKLVEITDYGFAAITRLKVDEALLAEAGELGWRLVIGDATELAGLSGAYQRVTSLRSRVQSTGKSARVGEVSWTVTGLLGREAGTMLAGRLLEPLLSQDADRRRAQLSVLRSWLGENGNWDATAKVLGLHRNSVRRQINAVAELLDMDLNEAQVRAELWIALQYADELPETAQPSPEPSSPSSFSPRPSSQER